MYKHKLRATALALSLLTPFSAHAAYVVSYTNISDFGTVAISGDVSIGGFSFSNSAVANDTGDSAGDADFGVTGSDADASCIGAGCSTSPYSFNNEFYQHAASDFIYGDAVVGSTDIDNGIASASAIAEANITNGTAYASGSNSLTGGYIDVGTGGAEFMFVFDVRTYLEVTGGTGTAWSSLNFTIDNEQLNFAPVDYSIGSGFVDVWELAMRSNSISLTEGRHSISIAMDNNVSLTAVPVPAAVWLFGSGLIGLAGVARRRSLK